jgi:hypothetical protein
MLAALGWRTCSMVERRAGFRVWDIAANESAVAHFDGAYHIHGRPESFPTVLDAVAAAYRARAPAPVSTPTPTLLPGSLPGLLARGCPVVYTSGPTPIRGIVTGYAPAVSDAPDVSWDGGVISRSMLPSALALDMDDPAGMDRAARWLAERVGLVCGATAPEWRREQSHDGDGEITHYWALCVRASWARGSWVCFHDENQDDDGAVKWVLVPGISTLTNPAAALALAVMAVSGGSR